MANMYSTIEEEFDFFIEKMSITKEKKQNERKIII